MKSKSKREQQTKRQGLPFGAALAILAGIAVVAALLLGSILYFTASSKAKIEKQLRQAEEQRVRNDLRTKKADEDAKLATARNHQDEVLVLARNATNIVGRLLGDADRLAREATALKTSNSGRLVALDADLIAQARRLYEVQLSEVPTTQEITSKLESVRRIEQQVLKSLGTAYDPEIALKVTVQNTALWADQAASKVSQAQALLDALVRDGKVKNPAGTVPPGSPTLEAAIAKLKQDELAQRQKGLIEGTDQAKKAANATLLEAERQRILEEARIKAEKMLSDAKKAADDFKRQQELDKAREQIHAATNKVDIESAELEARKVVLRQKASQPDVKTKLAPFITPGLWRPVGRPGDLKPHSYTQLQTVGALNRTQEGRRKLVEIAHSTADKVRPRWNFGGRTTGWMSRPADVATVTEAQDLLIELGPVLVEMKLLEP